MAKKLSYKDTDNIKCNEKIQELLLELPYYVTEYTYELRGDVTPRTAMAYIYDLRRFFQWLCTVMPSSANKQPKDILVDDLALLKINDINEYKFFLTTDSKNPNKEKGVARKMASLNSFLDFLYRTDRIINNPMDKQKISRHSKKKAPIIRLQKDETAAFLNSLDNSGKGAVSSKQEKFLSNTKIRDIAIVTTFLGTGIRVSELVGLDLSDINFKEHKLRVIRKGEKIQNVAIGDEVEEALKTYLTSRSDITPLPEHENALFLSTQRRRISVRAVENLIKKYSNIAGIQKNITPHKLRKTFGTELYNNTGDIYLVARALGHSSVNTSKDHYILSEEDSLIDARNIVKIDERK